jgi:hypothetical protein
MSFENEASATAAAAAEEAVDGVGEATFEGEGGTGGEFSDSPIVTEAYTVPPATPKSHAGSITGMAVVNTKTGTVGLRVTFHSDSNGRDYEQTIWPPAAWAENPRITREELGTLPTAEGKKQSPLQRFGSAISNSKGTGDVDKLIAAVKKAGRTFGRATYTTIDEFVEYMNQAISGCPVVFTTREEQNDDAQYQARERVNNVFGHDFDATKLKAYTPANGA